MDEHHGDDGQILPLALGFVLAVMLVLSVVVDGGAQFTAANDARADAAAAARAGASALSPATARGGQGAPDPVAAQQRAEQFLAQAGRSDADVEVDGATVTVRFTVTVRPVIGLIVGTRNVNVVQSATNHEEG